MQKQAIKRAEEAAKKRKQEKQAGLIDLNFDDKQ